MLLNLNQRFVSMDGRIIKDVQKNEGGTDTTKDLTLMRVISLALIEPVAKLTEDDKVKYFELCLKVMANKAGTVELTSEETTLIKAAVKPKFGVLLVGEAMRMLEGKEIGIDIVEDLTEDDPGPDPEETGLDEDKVIKN